MRVERARVKRQLWFMSMLLAGLAGIGGWGVSETEQTGTVPEFRVENYPGGDVGARIDAAGHACSAAGRPCLISVNRPGVLSAAVTLAPGHSLLFRASVEVVAPVGLAGSQTVSCSSSSLSFTKAAGTIKPLAGATDIAVRGCRATGVGQAFVELPGRNARVRVEGVTSSGFGNTLLACPAVARQGGGGWDLSLLCRDIDFVGNTVLQATGTGVQYGSVVGGEISGNTVANSPEGIYLNGGEADPAHALFAFRTNGLRDIRVFGNRVSDIVNGCIWATVSSGHVFANNRLSHCGDVALDFEGVHDSRTSANTITDAGHRGGALATFFGSSGIEFVGDHVVESASGSAYIGPVIWVHNSTNDPAFTGPVTFLRITAISQVRAVPGVATFESTHQLSIVDSHFDNVRFSMPFRFQDLRLEGNEFRYSVPVAGGAALAVGVSLYGGTDHLVRNRFIATVPQPPGSVAVSMTYSDFNATEIFDLRENDFLQAAAFAADISITHQGQNPGVGSRWTVRGNHLNRPPLVQANGVGAFTIDSDGGTTQH